MNTQRIPSQKPGDYTARIIKPEQKINLLSLANALGAAIKVRGTHGHR